MTATFKYTSAFPTASSLGAVSDAFLFKALLLFFSMFQCSLTGSGERCVHSPQECCIYYTSACSNGPSPGAVYGVFIAHKNVIYIIFQHVPMLPHWGQCTVCSKLTRMLYILYFSMFRCSLTGGGVRCVHSSQECYIYYTSACSNAPSLVTSYGVFKVHKIFISIILQHVPMLPRWGWPMVVEYRTPVSLRHQYTTATICPSMVG